MAGDILKFLHLNDSYSPLLVHGFSIGGYIWGEVMVRMSSEKVKYQALIDRVIGQIWDSAADVSEIPIGLPIAVFPNNTVMQNTLRSYIMYVVGFIF